MGSSWKPIQAEWNTMFNKHTFCAKFWVQILITFNVSVDLEIVKVCPALLIGVVFYMKLNRFTLPCLYFVEKYWNYLLNQLLYFYS